MLVKFKTNSHGDVTMLGDMARVMLKMMGQSGEVPGAVMAPDVSKARDALLAALEAEENNNPSAQSRGGTGSDVSGSEDAEPVISKSTRAGPLLDLLESAIESADNVTWDH